MILPSERTSDSMSKVEAYLRHGVQEVWQVFLALRQVVVLTPQATQRLAASETLSTSLLPEFTIAVSSLFED